jgi:hypothetical protein
MRNGLIGFAASAVSDIISNSMRVIKTHKQASYSRGIGAAGKNSYLEITRSILSESGIVGLFGRGLNARLIANGIQSMLFTIIWKILVNSKKPSETNQW